MIMTMRRHNVLELSERSREIFRELVDTYVETGEPVGSRTLSRRLAQSLSPATIRNVLSDLEELGLLFAPHAMAGRVPTDAGMKMFISGLLELSQIPENEKEIIDLHTQAKDKSVEMLLQETLSALSGLSRCAGLVVAPKIQMALKHIEFIPLGPQRLLVVLVTEDGMVENRILEMSATVMASTLIEASNYLNSRIIGKTIEEAQKQIAYELETQKNLLDELTGKVVSAGLASWAGGEKGGQLIVRGQSNLLADITALEDLERIRNLFETLETKEILIKLLEMTQGAEGVQIFIGAENDLFKISGCALIVAPYHNSQDRIVGAVGVIGPARLNYARIIPLVNYTARMFGRLIGNNTKDYHEFRK
jgi:heat-inducible transcriptional repressor